MQFNDTATNQGIIQAITDYTGASLDDYSLEQRTRAVNKYVRRATQLIQKVDNKWQYDDKNTETLPIETTDLVEGQRDYVIDPNVRDITRVECLIEGGETKKQLRRLDRDTIHGSIEEVFDNNAQPVYYSQLGESILLYPSPNYSLVDGLIIWTKRASGEFVPTDTTKEPPFDSQYHEYVALGASYDHLLAEDENYNKADRIKNEMREMEADIKRYYSRRGGKARIVAPLRPRI